MSPILEVLIGIFFIFSLLSILVTQINAIISQILRLRSEYLMATVKNLIHDPELTARFVTHPLVRMIEFKDVEGLEKWDVILPAQKLTKDQATQIVEATRSGVDWLDPKNFSSVLLSLISVHEDRKLFIVLDDIAAQMDNEQLRRDIRRKINMVVETGEGIDNLVGAINSLPASAHKKALVERLRDISKEIGDKGLKTDINVSLMAGVQYIKDQYLKNAINTILTTSKTLDEVEEKITRWFDDANYKASDTFKRHMKWYSYLIGLLIALILNIDTMDITLKLWEDPVLRNTIVQVASDVAIEELQGQLDDAGETIESDADATVQGVIDSTEAASNTIGLILETRVPIGWDFTDLTNSTSSDPRIGDARYIWNYNPGNNDGWLWLLALKTAGILATTLAVGQGAPFWFNILKQLK